MTKIIIRAIPDKRVEYVEYLERFIPDAVMCYDQTRNAMDTFLSGMRMAEGLPAVHMEDDVILTKGFREKLEAAIEEKPDTLIQFFSMRKKDHTEGSRLDRSFTMNQCHYHPAGYSEAIADFYDIWPGKEEHPTGYDLLIRDWLKSRREPYWIHCPNLVDHRVCKSEIDPRRSSKRQSYTFSDPEDDGACDE